MVNNSNDADNFSHMLLLTDKQIPKLYKAFANNLSTIIKLSKT